MNYYCKDCGTVYITKELLLGYNTCPYCDSDDQDYPLKEFPDYETPEQYKKRTRKRYPDNGAVWVRHRTEGYSKEYWQLSKYLDTKNDDCRDLQCLVVIASPPVPPPNNFVPKEAIHEGN